MTHTVLQFDAIIVGSGTSAHYSAEGLLNAGKKIAIVDELPFGGTCALRGCQPKKYLVANAEVVAAAHHLVGKGIDVAPRTEWSALQRLKNEYLDGKSEKQLKSWQDKGVATFRQQARLSGESQITLEDGTVLNAEHVVLATGSSQRLLDIPGSEYANTSDDFLELAELPHHITFIGGGYISFEFAHVAARAGAKVTIVHHSEKPLIGFDPDMVDLIIEASRDAGITVLLNQSPARIEAHGAAFKLHTEGDAVVETDYIVAAIGRIPNLSVLEGNQGKVSYESKGILVNDFLQSTSNPKVYAAGDCVSRGKMLATVANDHGKIAALNILEGNTTTPVDQSVVPSAVFTLPNLAAVGFTEAQAKEKGLDFRVNQGSTTKLLSSRHIGEKYGGYKVLIDNRTGLLIGAHLARHSAAEVINIFALAIAHKIPAKALAEFLWVHPTITSDIRYMVS